MATVSDHAHGPGIALQKGPGDARYVENIMEHVFLSEVLRQCWFVVGYPVEVTRPDVDAGGFDLVLEARGGECATSKSRAVGRRQQGHAC